VYEYDWDQEERLMHRQIVGCAIRWCFLLIWISLESLLGGPKVQNWPQWRGPNSQGVSEEHDLTLEWSADEHILWKTVIPGRGHSSPIVWGKRVFVTADIEGPVLTGAKAVKHTTADGKEFNHQDSIGADRQHTMKVLCLDLETGRIVWERTAYDGRVFDNRHRKNTYASPTPITDGQRVYAYFGSEGLFAYDFSGNLLWKTSFGGIATMGMGVASSPVLWQDLLFFQCDQDNGVKSFLAAVDRKTGREVWRVHRVTLESWTSPVVAFTDRRPELIVNAREVVISYNPADGAELWRVKGVGPNPVPTPVLGHGLAFFAAGAGDKRSMAVRLGGSGDLTDTDKVVWKYNKGTAHIASPILYQNHIYLMTDAGLLTCLDARTGEVQYEGKRVPVPAAFTASPVAVDGKILITSEDGDTFVITAGPRHEILRTNSIGEPVYASMAISQRRILIRGEKSLYCVGNTQ
jgi:outer membrane protein assembly factor BamB